MNDKEFPDPNWIGKFSKGTQIVRLTGYSLVDHFYLLNLLKVIFYKNKGYRLKGLRSLD